MKLVGNVVLGEDTRTEDEIRRAATPTEVWSYQGKTVMTLTTLGSLGLEGGALGLTGENTLYDAVMAAIAAMPDPDRMVAQIQFDGAPGFRRDAPLLASLAPVIGLTEAQTDNLFIAAKAVP